jgi:hypothetical protein
MKGDVLKIFPTIHKSQVLAVGVDAGDITGSIIETIKRIWPNRNVSIL